MILASFSSAYLGQALDGDTLAFPVASSCAYTAGSYITRYCDHEKFRIQAAPGDAEGAEPDRDP